MSTPESASAGIAGLEVTESKDYHLLPVEQRAQLALASSKTETDLKAMVEKHATIIEIKDKAGREQAHGAAMELMRARTTVANVSKAARDDATKFSRAVIAEENRLIAIVEAEEKRLKDLRDAWDDEQARLKREAEERERQRLLAIANRISEIKAFAVTAGNCRTSARVQELITKLEAVEITAEAFAEFKEDAEREKLLTLIGIRAVFKSKQDAEAEAQRLADMRAEQDRVRQEQEERQRQLDEQAAALERQRQELAAAQAPAKAASAPVEELSPPPAAESIVAVQPETAPAAAVAVAVSAGWAAMAAVAAGAPHSAVVEPQPTTNVVALTRSGDGTGAIGRARPTDDVIIGALALHFRAHEMEVIGWLLDMNLVAASERISAQEFA